MILYEYRCQKCGCKFQWFISSKDRLNVSCPSCNSKNVKKLWATISSIIKSKSCRSRKSCSGCEKYQNINTCS